MGNVNGWRGWAIGHGDAISPPLSRPYLPNHLGAVMGPVQLSELSQELKPAPARGLDQETVRADRARAGKAGMERRVGLGPPGSPDHQGPRSERGGSSALWENVRFWWSEHRHPVQEGTLRQQATSGSQWGWGPQPCQATPGL